MAYLTSDAFRDETIMPAEHVDEIMTFSPKWLDRQLAKASSWIDSKLRKRYAAPFAAPVPDVVIDWVTRIVTHRCYLRRGVDPTDAQAADVKAAHDSAIAEVTEAADGKDGLYDLPLRADTDATGVSKGTPLSYSEASPYVGNTIFGNRGHAEDASGSGTGNV